VELKTQPDSRGTSPAITKELGPSHLNMHSHPNML
jgi:hypothetical protein